jgi:hypothetical protein
LAKAIKRRSLRSACMVVVVFLFPDLAKRNSFGHLALMYGRYASSHTQKLHVPT